MGVRAAASRGSVIVMKVSCQRIIAAAARATCSPVAAA